MTGGLACWSGGLDESSELLGNRTGVVNAHNLHLTSAPLKNVNERPLGRYYVTRLKYLPIIE